MSAGRMPKAQRTQQSNNAKCETKTFFWLFRRFSTILGKQETCFPVSRNVLQNSVRFTKCFAKQTIANNCLLGKTMFSSKRNFGSQCALTVSRSRRQPSKQQKNVFVLRFVFLTAVCARPNAGVFTWGACVLEWTFPQFCLGTRERPVSRKKSLFQKTTPVKKLDSTHLF